VDQPIISDPFEESPLSNLTTSALTLPALSSVDLTPDLTPRNASRNASLVLAARRQQGEEELAVYLLQRLLQRLEGLRARMRAHPAARRAGLTLSLRNDLT